MTLATLARWTGIAALLLWLPVVLGQTDTLVANDGAIEITPMVHASVQLRYDGLVIQIDPWGVPDLERFEPADIILITDTPSHHMDLDTIALLSRPHTTLITPANASRDLPTALVLANGERLRAAGITVEAVAAYDIIPGAPEHPRGDANGYVLTLGGKRLFFAGVTECVEEVRALTDIDVAFLPLNIPPARMTPAAAADCAHALAPTIVYTYHYDQGYARRLQDPAFSGPALPGGLSVAESLDRFAEALSGSGIDYRRRDWYPLP